MSIEYSAAISISLAGVRTESLVPDDRGIASSPIEPLIVYGLGVSTRAFVTPSNNAAIRSEGQADPKMHLGECATVWRWTADAVLEVVTFPTI